MICRGVLLSIFLFAKTDNSKKTTTGVALKFRNVCGNEPPGPFACKIQEGTYFLALHDFEKTDARLCCLHDTENKPKPFSDFQSYNVTVFEPNLSEEEDTQDLKEQKFYRDSGIFKFLIKFLSYPDNNPIRTNPLQHTENLKASSKRIAEAFRENRSNTVIDQNFYLPRLEIYLKGPKGKWEAESWESATVTFGPTSQALFQTVENILKWPDFKKYLIELTGTELIPLWLTQLEDSIKMVMLSPRVPMSPTAVMYSPWTRRFYRPQLSRVDRLLNGDSKAYIMLVEQLPSDFQQHEDLGILLASLIVGARFKFEFIDPRLQRLRKEFTSDDEFDEFGKAMLNQIIGIEAESAQHGLLDPKPSLTVYPESERETVMGWYDDWKEIREKIFQTIGERKKKRKSVEEIRIELCDLLSGSLSELNTKFMRKATDMHAKLVSEIFPIADK